MYIEVSNLLCRWTIAHVDRQCPPLQYYTSHLKAKQRKGSAALFSHWITHWPALHFYEVQPTFSVE